MATAQTIIEHHEAVKAIRGRGLETPSHLETVAFLRALEREVDQVRSLLSEVWISLDATRDFRKASVHMDHAQQRLHKVIKRLGGEKKK